MVILGGAVDEVDLSSVLVQLQIAIKTAKDLYGIDLLPQLINGAIATLESEGFSREFIAGILQIQSITKQWWILRQFISPAAIAMLERKSTAFLSFKPYATSQKD